MGVFFDLSRLEAPCSASRSGFSAPFILPIRAPSFSCWCLGSLAYSPGLGYFTLRLFFKLPLSVISSIPPRPRPRTLPLRSPPF